MLLCGAPAAALLAGLAAEWLDFRALRAPLLLMVLAGVIATSHAVASRDRTRSMSIDGRRTPSLLASFAIALVVGLATWGAAEAVYAAVHPARGGAFSFDASPIDSQWAQGVMLVLAHAFFLGAPTGLAAGAILQVAPPALRRLRGAL